EKRTDAICVYVSNLVTKNGQTEGFTVSDHAKEIERFVGGPFLDFVLYNEQKPVKEVARRYEAENAFLVKIDKKMLKKARYKAIAGNFLGDMASKNKDDMLMAGRSLIRHDARAVANALINIYESKEARPVL
ncbi:MAG TPA: 2-phospho-L-lactate transferase CofD family protein, partial [Candidatus Saccharimonadales bacterium]|nr:2-phospho-L-lactate transferase CofD family protein [Candidatus Saccharimonadales bacterium]